MATIQGINILPKDEAKLNQIVQQQQQKQATANAANNSQSIFGAADYTNEDDTRNSNTAAFQNMDSKAQGIIMDNIKKAAAKGEGGVMDFRTVTEDFNKNGYTAKYIESDRAADNAKRNGIMKTPGVEITTPDGKTFRIWDGNGNGGIDEKDFKLDQNLKDFVSDVKAAGSTHKVEGAQATETAHAVEATDKTQTVFEKEKTTADKTQTTADKAKNVDDKQILNYLKSDLRRNGNVAEKEIEPKAQEMLPIYKMLLALDLPWLNRLFNIKEEAL